MADEEREEAIEVPLVWIGVEDAEIAFVNQLVVQHQGNEFILTFGQQAPPMILGDAEETIKQAREIEYVPVRIAARIGITAQRMAEFVQVMQQNLQRYEQRGE